MTGSTYLYMNVSFFTCLEFPLSWFLLLSLNTRSCAHTHINHKTQIHYRLLYLISLTIKKKTYTKQKIVTVRAVCPLQISGQCNVIFIDFFSWTNIGSSEKGTKLWLVVLQSNWRAHTEPKHTHTHTRTSTWQFFLFLPVVGTFFLSGMLDVGGDTGVSSLPPLLCGHKDIYWTNQCFHKHWAITDC